MNITAEKNGILSMPALSGISRQRVSQSFLRLEATLGTIQPPTEAKRIYTPGTTRRYLPEQTTPT